MGKIFVAMTIVFVSSMGLGAVTCKSLDGNYQLDIGETPTNMDFKTGDAAALYRLGDNGEVLYRNWWAAYSVNDRFGYDIEVKKELVFEPRGHKAIFKTRGRNDGQAFTCEYIND